MIGNDGLSSGHAGGEPKKADQRGWLVLAGCWGFAEASLFFVVPDVLLSWLTLRWGWRVGVRAIFAAIAGACLGGVVMALWAHHDPPTVRSTLDALPAISASMIAETERAMMLPSWPLLMLAGSVTGVPYKVFAFSAGVNGVSLPAFVAATIPTRLFRFVLVVALVAVLRGLLLCRFGRRRCTFLLFGFWVLQYAVFWTVMPT